MKDYRSKKTKFFFLFLLVPVCLTIAGTTQAEGIHARYLENSGRKTVLELTVEDPPPTSIIVQQRIPPGITVEQVTPAYTKFAASKGVVKWLFKRPQPGLIQIVMHYTTPLADKGATAVIRCKSPSTGQLMIVHLE